MENVEITIVEQINDIAITVIEVADVTIDITEQIQNIEINVTSLEEVGITITPQVTDVLIQVNDATVVGGGGGSIYKISTKPTYVDIGGELVSHTGFSTNFNAATSSAEWAVKKELQDGTETWAGKADFDQILDDYLSLTYS